MKITQLIAGMLILALTACGGRSATPAPSADATPVRPTAEISAGTAAGSPAGIPWQGAAALGSYTARFTIDFSGQTAWRYLLLTRARPGLSEQSLHIEGVPAAQNPGDVRMVSDGGTMWMIGAGTAEDCLRFPLGQGLDPKLLTPETIFPPQALAALFADAVGARPAGDETILGRAARRYSAEGGLLLNWQVIRATLAQDAATGALLALEVEAAGDDGFFGAGAGTLTVRYTVEDLSEPAILPVGGCESTVPLPEGISGYVRLPGLESFESDQAADTMVRFYQERLAQEGWAESEPVEQSESAWVLSYARGGETVGIQVEPRDGGGSKVKIMIRVAE